MPETQDNEPARSQTFTSPFEETNHYVSHLKSNTLTTKPAHLHTLLALTLSPGGPELPRAPGTPCEAKEKLIHAKKFLIA